MQKLVVLAALICLFTAYRSEAQPLPVNQLPMYGGVEKTEAMKAADDAFVAKTAEMGYTKE